jgi:hypothetical protein
MVEMDFMSRKEEAKKKRFDISVLVGLASSGVLIVVLVGQLHSTCTSHGRSWTGIEGNGIQRR